MHVRIHAPDYEGNSSNLQKKKKLTCVFVSPEQQGRRVGVDQKLHVVQGKLLDVVPQLVLLIHALEESQSGGPHLRVTVSKPQWNEHMAARRKLESNTSRKHGRLDLITFSFSCELRSRRTCRYWNCLEGRLTMSSFRVVMPRYTRD